LTTKKSTNCIVYSCICQSWSHDEQHYIRLKISGEYDQYRKTVGHKMEGKQICPHLSPVSL